MDLEDLAGSVRDPNHSGHPSLPRKIIQSMEQIFFLPQEWKSYSLFSFFFFIHYTSFRMKNRDKSAQLFF